MGQSAQLLEGERRGFRNVLSVLSVLSAGPVTKRAELTNVRRCFLDVGNHLWPLGHVGPRELEPHITWSCPREGCEHLYTLAVKHTPFFTILHFTLHSSLTDDGFVPDICWLVGDSLQNHVGATRPTTPRGAWGTTFVRWLSVT